MKNTFSEFNKLGKELLVKLWDDATFVFDSNVILNLYRYSDVTSGKFLETILELKDRVWVPYQVGLEFNKRRLTVISEQKKHYQDFEKKINDIVGEIEDKNRNPFLSSPLFEKLVSIKLDIKKEVDEKIAFYDKALNSDQFLEEINLAFEGRVGKPFSEEELKKVRVEGTVRYDANIPPGYCDKKKPESEKYGDLILWKQIISYAEKSKKDIIFISDDRKDDWWLEHNGFTISPRPELLKEFMDETKRRCHFYKPFQFLNFANEYLGKAIKQEVIEEVKNYKLQPNVSGSFVKINLTLKAKNEDLIMFENEIKNAGYNLITTTNEEEDLHNVFIVLPNIPDLERRLNSKYLSNLTNYNIKLVSTIKD
jgi:hypothetical protein